MAKDAHGSNWTCPHCGRHTTINSDRRSADNHRFTFESKNGEEALTSVAICCPNSECREITLTVSVARVTYESGSYKYSHPPRKKWTLIPEASVKVFPDYIPVALLGDYREACLIRTGSPKASATLARRCLQGMIRDFWGIKKKHLAPAINALKGRVEPNVWKAIDAVRQVGNIGAHMEKDINLIIDVEPNEAELLIDLIERLLTEWYVHRHEREQSMGQVIALAETKKRAKSRPNPSDAGTT